MAASRTTRGHEGADDTRHDHDYTDWDAVEQFARSFAAKLPATV